MTHYEVLQVSPTASTEIITMAYQVLTDQYRSEIYQGDRAYAAEKLKQIKEAYRVLASPDLRRGYDRLLQIQKEKAQKVETVPSEQVFQPEQAVPAAQPEKEPPRQQKRRWTSSELRITFMLAFLVVITLLSLPTLLREKAGKNETAQTTASLSEEDLSVSTEPVPSPVETSAAPEVKTEPEPEPELVPAAVVPKSGEILSGFEWDNGSELTITASSNASCVVKLKNASDATRLSFYVRAGETVTVGVPAEFLYVYFASGTTWYGEDLWFGEDTYYFKDEKRLDFTQYTWEYTLSPVTNGNFEETPIDADEF